MVVVGDQGEEVSETGGNVGLRQKSGGTHPHSKQGNVPSLTPGQTYAPIPLSPESDSGRWSARPRVRR